MGFQRRVREGDGHPVATVPRRASLPRDLRSAASNLRFGLSSSLPDLPARDFVRVWSSVAYLYPGLHVDGYEDADSGWPRVLRPFAAEACRRADAGQLSEEALYPSDAAWAGIHDRMPARTKEETARRTALLHFSDT